MTLHLSRIDLTGSLDVSDWPWDTLPSMSAKDAAQLTIKVGRHQKTISDVFKISRSEESDGECEVRFSGDCSRIHGIGAGLSNGTIVVQGDAGDKVGERMTGGHLVVEGSCGHQAGRGMKNGRIVIHGNAGDELGSALPGMSSGMRGGEIFVRGNAGDSVGERMRRGLIAVAGTVGECAGLEMLAGTIVIGQAPKSLVGLGMKRGSILVFETDDEYNPGLAFTEACNYSPVFVSLLMKRMHDAGFLEPANAISQFTRFSGDRLELNRGELLVSNQRLPVM